MIVVTPCGSKKKDRAAHAGRLYDGPYFRACLAYALSRTDPQNIYILSAKHGLLSPDEVIAPYDLHMNSPEAVTAEDVQADAEEKGIIDEDAVVLGGKAYREATRLAWPDAETPLKGKGGMGKQMQWLKQHTSS